MPEGQRRTFCGRLGVEASLGIGEHRGVEQQRPYLPVSPLASNLDGRPTQQRGVIVGEPAKQNDGAPTLFSPYLALDMGGRLGAEFVRLFACEAA